MEDVLRELRKIPGVGVEIAKDLWNLGFRSIKELRDQNPEQLYDNLCAIQGQKVDRCMLYVFRCAVYFATEPNPKPEKLKWWYWKDK